MENIGLNIHPYAGAPVRRILNLVISCVFILGFAGCSATSPVPPNPEDPLTAINFVPNNSDKTNLALAYLSYIGEDFVDPPHETNKIFYMIKHAISKTPQLLNTEGHPDWKIVWGPAIYTFELGIFQDNGMFVAQQKSNPDNYVVAIRGTNFIAVPDWIFEDFDVVIMRDWEAGKGSPKISAATNEGVWVLQEKMKPTSNERRKKLPGEGLSLEEYLKNEANNNRKINVSFTGHSLGGALAPTLALYFKERQGQVGEWDSQNNATITATSFAGATAGNKDFASYSNHEMGSAMRRIHNLNDVVPHAWNQETMEQIKGLYQNQGLEMDLVLKLLLDTVIDVTKDKNYTQIEQSLPFRFPVNKKKDFFLDQISYQHTHSYPLFILGSTDGHKLINLVKNNKGKIF